MREDYKEKQFIMASVIAIAAPILTVLAAVLVSSCSHVSPYIRPAYVAPADSAVGVPGLRLLLIGDAGDPGDSVLALARAPSPESTTRTVVVVLGDNAYPEGMTARRRADASTRLTRQLAVVEGTAATALFIPGNHDWANGKPEGLAAVQAQEAFLADRAQFLPSGGCPGPAVLDVPESEPLLRLLALDTQWWLHDGPKGTDGCSPTSREGVAEALASRTGRAPVLYAAGHEHSLQVLRSDVVDLVLVSGAGSPSEVTAVASGPNTVFAHEHAGFMALDVIRRAIRLTVLEPPADPAATPTPVFAHVIPVS
jgi:hypothetical protein